MIFKPDFEIWFSNLIFKPCFLNQILKPVFKTLFLNLILNHNFETWFWNLISKPDLFPAFIRPFEEQSVFLVMAMDICFIFYRIALNFFLVMFWVKLTPKKTKNGQKKLSVNICRHFLSCTVLGVAATDLARINILCTLYNWIASYVFSFIMK